MEVLTKGDATLTSVPHRAGGRPLPEDFERIFNENHALVYRVAYRITGNNEDAEDVLQTLFLRLLRREILPDIERNPKAYMHRAAINIALDIVKLRARNISTGNVEEQIHERTAPVDRMPAFRVQDWLREALSELNPRAAEIFVLKHVEGYDNAEIAKMLGTSRGTIAVLLFRARARLKKSVRRRLGENL
ncbi:MAG TPA: sigma-70 family RNA polymerase sigma factor [Terriglobia bacterium]|nr:sigma-70 family RNA polymerase sigma factor [Terriglobia bacterium]